MDSIKRLKRFGHRHLHYHHRGGEIPDTPDNGEGPSTLRPSTSGASSQTTSAHSEISRPSSASATQAAQSTPSASDLQTLIPPALPATDATLQVPSPEPSQKTSLSQKLWDDAYDSIEESNAELYEAYCDTLAKALTNMKLKEMKAKGTSETPSSEPAKLSKPNIEKIKAGFAAELKERAKRQEHMQKFVKDGQERFAKGWKVAAAVGGVAQAVLSAKPVVDLVLNSVPQAAPAAIPWAGVCIGLEILSKPANTRKSNLDGIAHVTSRMEWYYAITGHLLDKDGLGAGLESFESSRMLLESKAHLLYKSILLYQMRSVCSYYQNQTKTFFKAIAGLDDWDGSLRGVRDTEKGLLDDWERYDASKASTLRGELVNYAKGAEEQLKTLRQDLQDFFKERQREQVNSKNSQCLADLRVINPQDHIKTIEDEREGSSGLLAEAYKWILDDERYRAFTSWDPDLSPCRLLWVKGDTGTGKTMLMIGIVRALAKQPAAFAPSLSYFFCQGTDASLAKDTAILRSLMWMLLIQQPDLISRLQPDYEISKSALFEDKMARSALSRIFKAMLEVARPAYFVVDALDECDQGLSYVLELISESISLSDKVKWLVCSRPNDHVQGLKARSNATVVELDEETLRAPVQTYIDHKLHSLRGRPGYSDQVLEDVSREVGKRAENTFLWVWHVFRELGSEDGWNALDVINDIPSGLSELYEHMRHKMQSTTGRNFSDCKKVLVVTALAYRPLYLSELAVLAGLREGVMVSRIVDECGPFLRTKNTTVYLVHQSAKEYLGQDISKGSESWLRPEGPAEGHADICKCSIENMKGLKNDIYELRQLGAASAEAKPPIHDPLARMGYSCVFWLKHLLEAFNGETRLVPDDQVYTFFKTHFLHWLESLTLLGKLSDGIVSMKELLRATQAEERTEFHAFISDANKFVLYNRPTIEQFPLQIYCSALLFTPKASITRKQFEDQIPPLFSIWPTVSADWSPVEQTLVHSDTIMTMALEHGRGKLATASRRGVIQVWDMNTGEALQALDAGRWLGIRSLTFSHSGSKLTFAIRNGTAMIWDLDTEEVQKAAGGHPDPWGAYTLSLGGALVASACRGNVVQSRKLTTGHTEEVLGSQHGQLETITFLPGRPIIIASSGSEGTVVRVWDVVTGKVEQSLRNSQGTPSKLVFSGDGAKLAFAFTRGPVWIWDFGTRKAKQTLSYPPTQHDRPSYIDSWPLHAIALSHDGSKMAGSAEYQEYAVQLWDIKTGAAEILLQGHTEEIYDLVFSRNGSKLASSGTWDNTARIWNTHTGEVEQILRHPGKVERVAFSHNDMKLESTYWNHTTQILDITSKEVGQPPSHHLHHDATMATDMIGQRLVLGSRDSNIYLCDDATGGRAKQTLQGHTGGVLSVAFSHDGTKLASGSSDGTAKIWNVETGQEEHTLPHGCPVNIVTFSKDSMQLASVSRDGSAYGWSFVTGKPTRSFKRSRSGFISIAFSPGSGGKLVTASQRSVIELWSSGMEKSERKYHAHEDGLGIVAFSHDGTKAAYKARGTTTCVLNLETGTEQMYTSHPAKTTSFAFSNDDTKLASASYNTIIVWDVATGGTVLSYTGRLGYIKSVVFLEGDTKLALGCFDSNVRVWDVGTGESERDLEANCGCINSIRTFEGNSSVDLVLGSEEGTVQVWDIDSGVLRHTFQARGRIADAALNSDKTEVLFAFLENNLRLTEFAAGGEPVRVLKGHLDSINDIAFSYDGRMLASASDDRTVRMWNSSSAEEERTLQHTCAVTKATFSHDGTKLASVSYDNIIRMWDVAKGESQQMLRHERRISCVAFSPDGTMLAFGDDAEPGCIKLWNLTTGTVGRLLWDEAGRPRTLAFSADGTKLVSISGSFVYIWNVATAESNGTTQGRVEPVINVVSSPDGRKAVSWHEDGSIRVWEATSGSSAMLPGGNVDFLGNVELSYDGTRLASVSKYGDVNVWNLDTGKSEKTLVHDNDICCLAWSPDGSWLLTACFGRKIRIWDVATGHIVHILESGEDISAAAFSWDGTWLAAVGHRRIDIWNLETAQVGHVTVSDYLPVKKTRSIWDKLEFSSDCTKLLSIIGDNILVWELTEDMGQQPHVPGLKLGTVESWVVTGHNDPYYTHEEDRRGGDWLTRNGEKILYFPHEYKPMMFDARGDGIAIATYGERVVILGLRRDASPTL